MTIEGQQLTFAGLKRVGFAVEAIRHRCSQIRRTFNLDGLAVPDPTRLSADARRTWSAILIGIAAAVIERRSTVAIVRVTRNHVLAIHASRPHTISEAGTALCESFVPSAEKTSRRN